MMQESAPAAHGFERRQGGSAPAGAGRIQQIWRNKLVLDYLDLAEMLAARYSARGREREDLRQVAYLALVKAAQCFDAGKGTSFPSYAAPTIAGELKKHLRDRCWVIRPPRRIQDLRVRMTRIVPALMQRMGRTPTEAELAVELDAGVGEIREAMTASTSMQPDSIDAAGSGTDDGTLSDRLVEPCRDLEGIEELIVLNQAIKRLSPDDRELLYRRYFLEETQAALGTRFGVTQMQISRRLSRVLVQLQRSLTDQDDAAARTSEPKGRAPIAVAATGTRSAR